jgi:DNA-binding MarR family transcriptional regulator/GNAT superfamily N-acetyltransferase
VDPVADFAGTGRPTAAQVARVRAFNRFYTNVIGVLHGMYLDSRYTLTEGRVLYELAQRDAMPVSGLREALDIDAGYLSRVLGRLEADGLVTRHRSAADARRQDIRLAPAGHAAVTDLDDRAARQMSALLAGVDTRRLLDAMGVITDLLGPGRGDAPPPADAPAPAPRVIVLRPPALGDLGWVLHRHAAVYWAEFGWNADFEAVCARIIADYVAFRDSAPKGTAGWIAEVDGRPAGCVFCVPDSPGDEPAGSAGSAGSAARLRLLLVEPWARGLGLGSRLVEECLRFARHAGYESIVLWTYDRLAAARRVYQAAGFTLDSEHPDHAFGHQMMSQTWSRPL